MTAIRDVTVVGASLAGLSSARALRTHGYDGRITVVGAERHLPYDRPPLSKGFLTGAVAKADLALLEPEDAGLDLHWLLGTPAAALEPATHTVVLADGRRVTGDAVVVATGARARRLPGDLDGVHVLRTVEDAEALKADLPADQHSALVVVGAGFIGAEVASSARSLGLDVTVVEALATPLTGPLGAEMGAVVAGLHEQHGVHLRTGVGVARLVGRTRVEAVELTDGTRLPADVVLVGIGVDPEVAWLAGSGLEVAGGVHTDETGATAAPGVVAVGDCALSYDVHARRHVRAEHWTHALHQPTAATATLLGRPTPHTELAYFWSEQYGRQVQLAGRREGGEELAVVHGSVEEGSFVATYSRDGRLVAVLGVGATREFGRWRRQLRTVAAADLASA